jgi:hypothetical protein
VSIALLTLTVSSCAHGVLDELPTAPDPATTIRTLTITPPGGGVLIAGERAAITSSGPFSTSSPILGAFAEYGDGTGRYVPATWSSSDTSVLTVDGAAMTAVSPGEATVTARADRATATARFRVEPTIAGSWSGTLVIDQCAARTGSLQELICSNSPGRIGMLPPGATVPIMLTLQKDGGALTVPAQFGDLRGVLTGTDAGANTFGLTGNVRREGTTITVAFLNGRVRNELMEASTGLEVRIDGLPEHAAILGHFDNVTRR